MVISTDICLLLPDEEDFASARKVQSIDFFEVAMH